MSWFQRLILPFRFIYRYRARQVVLRSLAREALREERRHQESLLKAFLTSLELIQATSQKESTANAQALVEVAKAMTAQAEVMSEWMKLFQPQQQPQSITVRDEDEIVAEHLRGMDVGLPEHFSSLTPEEQLSWIYHQSAALDD